MKRKILEITEIDCGDKFCGGCDRVSRHVFNTGQIYLLSCGKFKKNLSPLEYPNIPRLPECLEAERAYKQDFIDRNVKYRAENA